MEIKPKSVTIDLTIEELTEIFNYMDALDGMVDSGESHKIGKMFPLGKEIRMKFKTIIFNLKV